MATGASSGPTMESVVAISMGPDAVVIAIVPPARASSKTISSPDAADAQSARSVPAEPSSASEVTVSVAAKDGPARSRPSVAIASFFIVFSLKIRRLHSCVA